MLYRTSISCGPRRAGVLVYHVVEPTLASFRRTEYADIRVGGSGSTFYFGIAVRIGLSAIRLYRDGDRDYRWTFTRRRLARIVPLYLVTCMAFLVLVRPPFLQLSWEKVAIQIGSHLLFLHNLHPWLHGSINGANWSVAAEMQFYVLAIAAVPLLSRLDWRWLLAAACSSHGARAWSSGARAIGKTSVRSLRDASSRHAGGFAIGISSALMRRNDGAMAARSALHCCRRRAPSPSAPFVWDRYWPALYCSAQWSCFGGRDA